MQLMTNVDRILAEAMQLSEEERSELADRLAKTVPSAKEIEAAWLDEAERRMAALDAGQLQAVPWAEARARIFAK
jgi:putative addiction module component (TIGR02574 family)